MTQNVILPMTIVAFALSGCANHSEENSTTRRTPIVICFDVEDYITPESEGMDDLPKWMAEIMTEEGVTGTFFVIGEKARSMEKRGRRDVIAAMARHDIGSHTNDGSIHPTITERLEKASWDEGVATILESESAGFDDLERIFGQRPVNLGRHGGSYGPQLVAALGQMHAGYVYSPVSLPGHNAVWFCNTLNFHGEGHDFGYWDNSYYRDDLFNPRLDALDSLLTLHAKDVDVMAFFANHPHKVRAIQFADFNYYKGANPGPGQWKTPELRPPETMKTAQKNFRRLIQHLKNRDDIELTTYRELFDRFSGQRDEINRDELGAIAGRILHEKKVIIDDCYTPAEIFAALTEALSTYKEKRLLPRKIIIQRPFGPLEMPVSDPECRSVPVKEVPELADQAREYISRTGHLPSSIRYKGKSIGAGSLLALFSELYVRIKDRDLPDQLATLPFEPYPTVNEKKIINEVAFCKYWPVHREDLDMSHLIEMTKLQLWTLKPAWSTVKPGA